MVRIIGDIAVFQASTIGFAVDGRKQSDPAWQPI